MLARGTSPLSLIRTGAYRMLPYATLAPCNCRNFFVTRRGGFHIRPCHLTATRNCPCILFPMVRRGRRPRHPVPFHHVNHLIIKYLFPIHKKCMRHFKHMHFFFLLFYFPRQASTKLRKTLWLSATCQRCSGCHCTACTKRYSGKYTASINPSGATAWDRSAGASPLMP